MDYTQICIQLGYQFWPSNFVMRNYYISACSLAQTSQYQDYHASYANYLVLNPPTSSGNLLQDIMSWVVVIAFLCIALTCGYNVIVEDKE